MVVVVVVFCNPSHRWSLGTLIYEMLTGWPPFYDKNVRKMCDQILRVRQSQSWAVLQLAFLSSWSCLIVCGFHWQSELQFPPTLTASEEVKDLVRGLLDRNPATRLGSRARGAAGMSRFWILCAELID